MNAKINKLEEQFTAVSDAYRKSDLFAGISIFVNGRTNPSADDLKRIMMTYGGTFHHYERSHTTYIVAENLPDVKLRQMQHTKKHILSPKWVVDCVRENRILDYTRYLLYTNQKTTQPCLAFDKLPAEATVINASSASNTAELQLEASLAALNKEISVHKNQQQPVSKLNAKTLNETKTAKDENFLTEFFNNSRLHHIATLGAGFKQYISELREGGKQDFTAKRLQLKQKLSTTAANEHSSHTDSYIMHIDMDCFFVSVGLREHAHLRGKPVAVTHSRGGAAGRNVPVHANADRQAERNLWLERCQPQVHTKVEKSFNSNYSLSEIASCSYEARKCGVRNGMFVGQALQLCPNLQTIPYDFEGYKQVGQQLYNTIAQYTLDIEAVSCDEMFVDLTELLRDLQTTPMQLVGLLRQEVRQITGCPCSAGVGSNK